MTRPSPLAKQVDSDVTRKDRIADQAKMIAKARADVAAGRLVDADKVDSWIDSLGTDDELPIPYSGR